ASVTATLGNGASAVPFTVSQTYDFAGRPVTATDENAQVYTLRYDVLGRPTSFAAPGTTATCTISNGTQAPCTYQWTYPGLGQPPGPIAGPDGYLVQFRSFLNTTQSHLVDTYLDGFGRTRKTIDHSAAADIYTETLAAYENGGLVLRRSLPHLSNGAVKYK